VNIELHLRKEKLESNPSIIVEFGKEKINETILSKQQIVYLKNLEHSNDTQLNIIRDDKELYTTARNHHLNKIFVDKVIVDDFWQFDESFYPPVTIFDKEYTQHLERVGEDDWIKNTLNNNTHLFFNGRLTWNIKYPVRRSFFKDYYR
tara:strand:- start:13935 stop:14378 length:444 start_codon:yes stop_codon:yes gene_type:complete